MEQWEVQRSSGVCSLCQKTLEPCHIYYAALIDHEDSFVRQDFCADCWETQQAKSYSFWQTRVPEPNQKRSLFVDDSVLINFFERLADETEPLRINFRFVLMLILMRKRILKYVNTIQKDGTEIWQMRQVGTDTQHSVINPHLDEEKIQEVSEELSAILRGDS